MEGAGKDEDVQGRINQIKGEIENTDSDYDREKLQERLAKLSGGVAVIKVGAATEVELKEKKHRIEDAVQSTKAAVEEGIVPGGGVALLNAQTALDKVDLEGDELTGANIVRRALEEPIKQIAVNAGLEGGVIVEKVRALDPGNGLNAATGEYGDMLKFGVSTPPRSRARRCRTPRRSRPCSSRPRPSSPRSPRRRRRCPPWRHAGRRHGLLSSAGIAHHDGALRAPLSVDRWSGRSIRHTTATRWERTTPGVNRSTGGAPLSDREGLGPPARGLLPSGTPPARARPRGGVAGYAPWTR